MEKLKPKDIYIYGKHKSFSDYIKIYKNRECIKNIESILSNLVFNKSFDDNSISRFYIFSKKKEIISGVLSQSIDSKYRKAPFFICAFFKNSLFQNKWEKTAASLKNHLNYMEKIKITDFKSFKDLQNSCNYLKEIEYLDDMPVINKSPKLKELISDTIKNNSHSIINEKRLIFCLDKNQNNDIIHVLYNIRKLTGQAPFSFIIKESCDNFTFTFFYKKFSANDLKSIWQW